MAQNHRERETRRGGRATGDATDARIYSAAAMSAPKSYPSPKSDGDASFFVFGGVIRHQKQWGMPGWGMARAGGRVRQGRARDKKPQNCPRSPAFFRFLQKKQCIFCTKGGFFMSFSRKMVKVWCDGSPVELPANLVRDIRVQHRSKAHSRDIKSLMFSIRISPLERMILERIWAYRGCAMPFSTFYHDLIITWAAAVCPDLSLAQRKLLVRGIDVDRYGPEVQDEKNC